MLIFLIICGGTFMVRSFIEIMTRDDCHNYTNKILALLIILIKFSSSENIWNICYILLNV